MDQTLQDLKLALEWIEEKFKQIETLKRGNPARFALDDSNEVEYSFAKIDYNKTKRAYDKAIANFITKIPNS